MIPIEERVPQKIVFSEWRLIKKTQPFWQLIIFKWQIVLLVVTADTAILDLQKIVKAIMFTKLCLWAEHHHTQTYKMLLIPHIKQQLGDYYKLSHNYIVQNCLKPSNIKYTRTQGYVTSQSIFSCKYNKCNFL